MKRIISILSAILAFCAISVPVDGQVIVGNYPATSFQSGAVLPSSCYGSAVFTLTTTWLPYYCKNGTYVAIGSGAPSTDAANLTNGSAGAQPYQTGVSTTAFVYPATNVNALNLDGNRTDSYTPDGTPERPYKTLTQLFAGASSVTGPYVVSCNPTPSAYTYTGAVTFPAYQTTIIGNGCVWNITGNVTVPGVYFISNLGTTITGTLAYTSTSTAEKVRIGGSLTVSGGITTSGYDHFFDMSILSNTVINVGSGSTPVFTNVVGTPLFKSASGSTAATVLTIIDSQSLASGAYTNVDMSNGGLVVIRGFVATNNNTVPNINLSGSSGTSTTIANSLASVSTVWAAAGTAYTYVDNGSLYGVLTGTHLLTPAGLGMSAPAANTMTVKSGTTGAATLDSGTTGAVNIGTGANSKAITIGNSTGTTAVNILAGTGTVKIGGTVSISSGKPWYDITIGATCNGTADDYTVLQANLTAAAGATAYVPANTTCETSHSLTLPINTDLHLAKNGTIQSLAGSTGWTGTCTVQTPTNATTVLAHIYGGGTIDANNLADCALWLPETWQSYVQNSHFKNGTKYGIHIGSAGDGGTQSYQTYVVDNLVEVGYQGTGTVTAGSAGIYLDAADQFVVGNVVNCYDIGIKVSEVSSHEIIERNHAWCYTPMTSMFEDNGSLNTWLSNYADSPATYGYHMGANSTFFSIIGGLVYANSLTPDNTMTGIKIDYEFAGGTIQGVQFSGVSASHRLLTDISFTPHYATGHFLSMSGNMARNVTTVNSYDSSLNLPATNSGGGGALFVNGYPAFHLYGLHNIFTGYAGNLTLTGTDLTGNGYHAAYKTTSGSHIVAIGSGACLDNTDGSHDVCIGSGAGAGPLHTYYGTFVGKGATASADNLANVAAIGNGATVDVSNKMVFGNSNILQTVINGVLVQTVGTAIASGTTIAPVAPMTHITGVTAISTITIPVAGFKGCIRLIPDGLWSTTTGGNIALGSTAVVGKVLEECYDGTSWYPSY